MLEGCFGVLCSEKQQTLSAAKPDLMGAHPNFRFGSGRDRHLFEFVAGKPPLKFRLPEAAIRH